MKFLPIFALSLLSFAAHAEQYVECTRSAPEFNLPQVCVTRGQPTPVPSQATANSQSGSISNSRATSEANNSLSFGGDKNKSLVAVFPPPSSALVPQASACLVTESVAGGIGWNLFQGASSKQYSDPICVLQWMADTATDATERAFLRNKLLEKLGIQ